jgi:hypothetical protein
MSRDVNDEPDLLDAEEELELVVRYFEEVERRLEAQSGAPVRLMETQSAWRALFAIARFLGAERDRNRAWKHAEPTGVAREFIVLVARFVTEKRLSWEELADQLHLEPRSFVRLADFADEEVDQSEELARLAECRLADATSLEELIPVDDRAREHGVDLETVPPEDPSNLRKCSSNADLDLPPAPFNPRLSYENQERRRKLTDDWSSGLTQDGAPLE